MNLKFNYQKEKEKFLADWVQEEKLLHSQNASEEIIAEMYRFSLEQFRSNRNYYLHKEEFASADDISEEMDLEANLSFLDNIENPALLKALGTLNYKELEIVIMSAKGLTESEIAAKLGQSQQNISKKMKRIKKYLRNFL